MNERLIYEWLRPELKGKEWRQGTHWDMGESYLVALRDWEGKRYELASLPPLDMNAWHSEVVPKLKAERAVVKFDSCSLGGWEIRGRAYVFRADPWQALTEYLEAK